MDNAVDLRSALDVVTRALLKQSRDDASTHIAAAEARAEDIIVEGRAHAEEITRSAEAEGSRSVESEVARRIAQGRREARRAVLGERRAAVERLRREAMGAVGELRRQPSYTDLEDGLASLALAVLGPDAEIERDPRQRGGVEARTDSRTVDLTLPSLAERCLRHLGTDVEILWT